MIDHRSYRDLSYPVRGLKTPGRLLLMFFFSRVATEPISSDWRILTRTVRHRISMKREIAKRNRPVRASLRPRMEIVDNGYVILSLRSHQQNILVHPYVLSLRTLLSYQKSNLLSQRQARAVSPIELPYHNIPYCVIKALNPFQQCRLPMDQMPPLF